MLANNYRIQTILNYPYARQRTHDRVYGRICPARQPFQSRRDPVIRSHNIEISEFLRVLMEDRYGFRVMTMSGFRAKCGHGVFQIVPH